MRLWPGSPIYPILSGLLLLLGLALLALSRQPGVPVPSPRAQKAPQHHSLAPKPLPPKRSLATVSAFELEQRLSAREALNRWNPLIAQASRKFNVPQPWIRAVMAIESGGRTLSGENRKLVSPAGAMGLMQLMPDTYNDMRAQYGLGPDPQDPHDNIFAGAAFLRRLFLTYGYPAMFSAYNDGPGNLEDRLLRGDLLPEETRSYVADIIRALASGSGLHGVKTKFTRPNGTPVWIDAATVVSVRAALPGEYAPGVQTVITAGKLRQGVRENLIATKAILRAHGSGI